MARHFSRGAKMKTCLARVVLLTLVACVQAPSVKTAPAPEAFGAMYEVERIELLPCVWVLYKPSLAFEYRCREGADY